MISIFADYAPETQRKDKFKLDMRVTRKQQSVLEQEPFFSLYLNKYGSMIMPVYVLSSIFNKICPRLSDFKLIRTKEIDKKWATQSKFGAYTLTSEKTKDGFVLEFDCHKPNLPIAQLLSMVYQIPQSANYTEYADDGTVKQPIITEFKSYLDQAFTVGLAGTRLTFNTDSLKKFFKTEEEKLSFSCIKSLVIEINRNYEFSTHFSILLSAKEAELLTRLEYSAIRNIDIFPIIAHWIVGNYEQGPTTSISLSRIASHVDPSSVQYAKINEHGLTINQKGEILYIPREVNNSKEYEAQYIAYCSSDDVTDRKFGFRYGVSPTSEKKLPANMMILVDWTNAKFTYANSNGVQTTMDLSQCRPLTATHVRNVFRRTILSPEYLSNLSLFGMTVELTTNQVRVNADGELMDMDDYLKRLMGDLPSGQYYTLYDMLGDSRFDPIVKTISIIANAIEKKRDSFIARYAISNWISVLGLAKAIAVYASDWAKYKGEDELIRSAAVNQEITKGWELPSVPFFNNAPGLMPHQARVMNMMKDDPAFTLLPVAAGGGKTPIAIMDILKLYSEGKNAPYMVLCPNNLVSQYVQEVMYFTKGRLNTIPITTAVVKREGLDRLQKIFEAAPRNTLVVVSYNAIKYNSHRIIYGTNTVTRYPIVEFLRQFKFGYALCDESHQLKSIDSIKSLAVRMLLSDIPCIRLASGTLAYNRITDLVGQTAIMDPSIFGDMQAFRYEYGKFESGKYLGLKKGAEAEINARIKESIVVAGAQRKEWAALLPQTETSYHMVHLSPIEQDIYEQVLSITADNLEANPSLRKAMAEIEKLKEEQKVHYDQDRQDIIDEREDKLGKRLTPYLQKLERLVVDPLKESAMMTEIPPNYVSEKVRKVVEIAEKHVFGSKKMVNRNGVPTEVVESLPVPGKIIVFTENIDSAKSVYEGFQKVGSRLAKNGLLYEASNKQELLEKFNTDPNIKWMVGVETSINTGLNLQAASRIIRAEYPWQPGALEQGNARILRPLLKSKDGRTTVFFDWVVCDGTIDTLKVSRLMAKSAEIARFEHPHDERYQKVGVSKDMFTGTEENQIPVISVTMKNIRAHLDFGSDVNPGPLYPYYVAMRDLHFIEKNDYENYRKDHPEEINPDGTMKSVPVPIEKNPKDAKLLRYVPYVEGTNLYHAGELGLQRLDEYLNAVQQDYDDEDDKSTFEADEQYKELVKSLKGETVYTEYGECYIYAVSAKKPLCKVIPVNTTDRIEMPISSVFLVTRKNVKPAQLHKAIAKEIGIVEYSEPSYVRPSGAIETERGLKVKDDSEFEIERRDESQLQLNLRVVLINGLLGFRFTEIDEHELGTAILEQNGFRLVPDYYRAQIKNYKMLSAWLNKMSESGFKFRAPYDYSGAWQQIAKAMKRSQVKQVETFSAPQTLITNIVTTGDLKTMLRWNVKPTTNQTVLRVQPMFSNGVVFAIMPSTKLYPAGNIIRRKRVSGMKWELGPKAYEIYFTKPQEALRCLTALQKDGITITNLAHVKKSISKARSKRFDDIDSIKEKSIKEKRRRLSVREVLDRKRKSKMADDDYEIQIIDDTKTKRKSITKKVKQKPVTKNIGLGRRRLSVREVLERKRGL